MARTKKVGITGRFGARYGRKAKRSVKIIEENMKKNHVCPKCDRPVQYLPVGHTFHKLLWQDLQHAVSETLKWRNKPCTGVHVVEQK